MVNKEGVHTSEMRCWQSCYRVLTNHAFAPPTLTTRVTASKLHKISEMGDWPKSMLGGSMKLPRHTLHKNTMANTNYLVENKIFHL